MDDRPPGGAIALDVYFSFCVRPSNKIVEDNIETQTRRNSIGGGISHERGTKPIIRQGRHVALDEHFGLAIWGDGIECSRFVQKVVACSSIRAARGRKDEASDTGGLCQLRHVDRGTMIDVVGQLRIQISEWVIGQRTEMNDGIKASKIRGC